MRSAIPADPQRVLFFDTTLRDGEQSPGAAMTMTGKLRIARLLADLGVDVIEAGFPVSSPQQAEAVREVVAALNGPTGPVVCALARAHEADIQAAAEALQGGARTRIHTFIATSDIHIAAKFSDARYGTTLEARRASVLRMAKDAVRQAKAFTDDVEFSAEDAGRTDLGFLCDVVEAAIEAGATTINIPDTTGYCTPTDYAALFAAVRDCCDTSGVVLSTHCHDDLGLAVANTLAAVQAGARQVEVTINGLGERAGNASLEEVAMALRVRGDRLGAHHALDATKLTAASKLVSVVTGFPVPPNKAIVGANAFAHEAGIHQHGVLKARETYEIMRADEVGQDPTAGIRLGRHSGRSGLFARLARLGLAVEGPDADAVYARFVALADRKKEIYDPDLRALLHEADPAMQKPTYQLRHFRVHVESGRPPEAEVTVYEQTEEVERTERSGGDGPVAALYAALDAATGQPHELVSYSIRSVSEGADSVGEVTVLIGHAGAYFRGVARDTDVLRASAEAYVDALNQLEAYRTERESVRFVGEGIMKAFGA